MRTRTHALVLALVIALGGCASDCPPQLPDECIFSVDYGCFSCWGAFGEDYQIACRATGDCKVFCGPLPAGYSLCDAAHSPERCAGFRPPGGRFAACKVWGNTGDPYFIEGMSCPNFCMAKSVVMLPSILQDDDGDCYLLSRTCLPNDFEKSLGSEEEVRAMCKNRQPPLTNDAAPGDGSEHLDAGAVGDGAKTDTAAGGG